MTRMIVHLREMRGKLDTTTQSPKKKPPAQKLEGSPDDILKSLGLGAQFGLDV